MLKPAILYKDELEKCFAEYLYTEDYYYYMGYNGGNELPNLEVADNHYQYAVVDNDNNVIGYFAYRLDERTYSVYNFGMFSFVRDNFLFVQNVMVKMKELVKKYNRVEWRVISGNPIVKVYDDFCKKYNGNKVCLHNVTLDLNNNFRDEYIYEIIKPKCNCKCKMKGENNETRNETRDR